MGKKRNRVILIVVEILMLIAAAAILIVVINGTGDRGVNKIVIKPVDVMVSDPAGNTPGTSGNISDDVSSTSTPAMDKYWNIALFGVDSTEGKLSNGTRTDCIIIASINRETKEVKLCSVYRDTYLYIAQANSDGQLKDYKASNAYQKCNAAYAFGGAKEALRMLNMNLGLNITDFVTVGFDGLTDAIDALGGVDIDVKQEEIIHLNNYQISIVGETDDKKNYYATEGVDYTAVTEPGLQTLNGLQATAYCRIRYVGNDFVRTERQRNVIKLIADKAQSCSVTKLTEIANAVMPKVYTSFSIEDVVALLGDVSDYKIVDSTGFPFEKEIVSISGPGDCVVATDLESNVKELHKYLFDDTEYEVGTTISEINETIENTVKEFRQ